MKHRHLHRRFLVPNARRGNGLGYDNRPQRILNGTLSHVDEPATIEKIASCTSMCDEPECISDGIVSYKELAKKSGTLRHAREIEEARAARKEITTEQRIRTARQRAKQQHVNVTHDLYVIRQMLARAAAGGRSEPTSAIRRLEALEARLDGAAVVERDLDKAA